MGGKGGGNSHTPVEAPNNLQSNAVAKAVDLISEGEIVGLVNGLQSIYFDNTPLQNTDGSYNYKNVVLDARVGLPSQSPILGFPNIETEVAVGAQVTKVTPITRTVSSPTATSLRVTVNIPALSSANKDTGDINQTGVSIFIEVQPNAGVFTQVVSDTIFGKTTSPYQRAYKFTLSGSSPWTVRVTRLTADSTSALLQNQTFWSTYTIIEDWQLSYLYSAYVATQVDAQSFGGKIPVRTYEVFGIKVLIPVNYDPIARTYATTGPGTTGGIWDGTFKTAWTNNPAWIFYDLIVNDRYGLGQFVPAAGIDKFKLYTIAQYCDALVPDGLGGFEFRYTFNGTIAASDDAMKVLVLVAGVFRGMVYWGPNGVSVVADMPGDPVKLITPANIIEGTINYSGSALKARHSVAHVTWFDPTNFYQSTIEVVEDADAIARFGYRRIEFVAFGCTSRGRAYRYGRWVLDTEKTATETAQWQASWDQADILPGDIVEVADPAYSGVDFGGRIAAATSTTVTVDRPVTIESGKTYALDMVLPDGTIAHRGVITAPSTTSILTFNPSISVLPMVNAIWVLTSSAVAPRQFRIISRVENDKHLFDFTALLHDPTKYARIEQGITLESPIFTALPIGPILAPAGLSTSEVIALVAGNIPKAKVVLSWTAAKDPRVLQYNIQSQPPEQNWQDVDSTPGVSFDFFDLPAGNWGFRVRSVTALGAVSPWATVAFVVLDGLTLPPDDLTNVRTAYVDGVINIRWDEVPDFRPVKYEIRKGDSWQAASTVGVVLHPPFETHGDGTYWIAAYIGADAAPRIYALNPSEVVIGGSLLTSNVLAIENEKATNWQGTFGGFAGRDDIIHAIRTGGITNELPDSNVLINPDILNGGGEGNGTYEIPLAHFVDIGRVAPCPISIEWKSIGIPVGQNVLIDPNVLVDLDFLGAANTQFIDVYPEISMSQGGGLITILTDPNILSEPNILSLGVDFSPYQKYAPGTYVGRMFRARMQLKTSDPLTIAYALEFVFTVDVPDRVDHETAIVVPAVGLPIVFTPDGSASPAPFNGGPNGATVPNVQVTIHDAQAGDTLTITSRTLAGCTVGVTNGGGPVQRNNIDIIAQGF